MRETRYHILYTIGHSNHTLGDFIALLQRHNVEMVVDVRSVPYSRYCSQFDKKALSKALRAVNIQYIFLGRELGARPDNPECYYDGSVDLKRIAGSKEFKNGLQRLLIVSYK